MSWPQLPCRAGESHKDGYARTYAASTASAATGLVRMRACVQKRSGFAKAGLAGGTKKDGTRARRGALFSGLKIVDRLVLGKQLRGMAQQTDLLPRCSVVRLSLLR